MQSWSKVSRHLKEIVRDGDPNQKVAGDSKSHAVVLTPHCGCDHHASGLRIQFAITRHETPDKHRKEQRCSVLIILQTC